MSQERFSATLFWETRQRRIDPPAFGGQREKCVPFSISCAHYLCRRSRCSPPHPWPLPIMVATAGMAAEVAAAVAVHRTRTVAAVAGALVRRAPSAAVAVVVRLDRSVA